VKERFLEPLRVVSGPERFWDGHDVKVLKPVKYGEPWSEEEFEYILLNPTLTFQDAGQDLGRTPGSVRRARYILRVVGGAISDSLKAPVRPGPRQVARRVLYRLGFDSWTPNERLRYLSTGRGLQTDKTRKAELLRRGLTGGRPHRA